MSEPETSLVALVSAVGGGLVGTWLQIRHERHAAFRERQISAADDFSTAFVQAHQAVNDAQLTCLEHGSRDKKLQAATGEVPDEIASALERAERAIADARARATRIDLLFGRGKAAPQFARQAILELQFALGSLTNWGDPPNLEDYAPTNGGCSNTSETSPTGHSPR